MGQPTSIEWADFTANPVKYRDRATGKDVWACVKHSPGCANCYAETLATRYGRGGPFSLAVTREVDPYLCPKELKWVLGHKPLAGKRVFVGDMTDVFGDWVSDAILDGMFAAFALRPDVTFMVLTKRADRLRAYMTRLAAGVAPLEAAARDQGYTFRFVGLDGREYSTLPWPLPNVWLGVSVEDQTRADQRIPHLLATPAAVRFLSCEPLLSAVDLLRWLRPTTSYHVSLSVAGALRNGDFGGLTHDDGRPMSREVARAELERLRAAGVKLVTAGDCKVSSTESGCPGHQNPGLGWAIAGGESGPDARPMHPDWPRSLRDQCGAAGVPFFFKQHGEWVGSDHEVARRHPVPHGEMVAAGKVHVWPYRKPAGPPFFGMDFNLRVGKKAAGRLLDGRTWDDFPPAAAREPRRR